MGPEEIYNLGTNRDQQDTIPTLPEQITKEYGEIFKTIQFDDGQEISIEISHSKSSCPDTRFLIFDHGAVEISTKYIKTIFGLDEKDGDLIKEIETKALEIEKEDENPSPYKTTSTREVDMKHGINGITYYPGRNKRALQKLYDILEDRKKKDALKS